MKHLVAACLAVAPLWPIAAAAQALPIGTLITGSLNGQADGLLGLDQGFAAVSGSNITHLANELEYLSSDYALGIDFLSDGQVVFYNNTDALNLPGSYTLTFDFSGLPQPLTGFTLGSGLAGGSVTASLLNAHSISITLSNVAVDEVYGSFSGQLQVSAVPEPGPALLLMAGLGVVCALRRRGVSA